MSKTESSFIILMSTLSFLSSVTTLGVVYVGAKKAEEEIEELKAKSAKTINKLKQAIINMEV